MKTATSNNQESSYKRIYHFLVNINLFDDKETLSFADQLITTRIFISLLTISLTIIIFFTAFSSQTYTVTIQSPSEHKFNKLAVKYPSTLSCPCQQTSIRQDEFISFNPEYHPICASQLINQTFISSLSDINVSDYWPLDYRIMIASHFQVLALLCQTMKQTITDAIDEFSSEHIITDRVSLPATFDAQAAALINQLKTTTVTTSQYTSDFLWFNIFQNGFLSGLRTNYYIQAASGMNGYIYFEALYEYLNSSCSCKGSDTCPHQAGIYNWTGRAGVNSSTCFGESTPDPLLLFNIPGIMVGCLPYSTLLQSTLECFYNQSCIDLIQTYINKLSYISPLASSYFAQNTTVSDILDQLFLESWNNESSFANYFRVCSPYSCTYSYNRRFYLLYVIVTIISLFGGLKIIFVVSSPYILKAIRKVKSIKCGRNTDNELPVAIIADQNQGFKHHLVFLVEYIYQRMIKFNIFPFVSNIHDGLYSTRLYTLLLTTGVLILVFYESISTQIQSVTVDKPSLNEYERLYAQYSSTLVCPCTTLSVSYSSIISIQPRYHQVCSSDFVKNDAWLLYNNGELMNNFFALDFRIIGMGMFRILQTLCQVSQTAVINEFTVFNDTLFVSTQVLSYDTFNIQTSTLIRQFEQQIISSYLNLFDMIRISTLLNQFLVAGNADTRFVTTETNDSTSLYLLLENDYDNDCSCGTNSSCTRSQGFYCTTPSCFTSTARPNQTIPGLVINCLPVGSLLLSSIECFYNASCIQMIIEWRSFETSNSPIDPRVTNVTPLDPMINSRFLQNTTISTIAGQLFIEDWTNSTSFSAYYEQCAPDQCVYTYEERFNIAYTISVILGIIGGLSTALRILIPPIVKLLRRIYYRCSRTQLHDERETIININFITHVREYIQTMNFYRKIKPNQATEELPTEEKMLTTHRQQIATRFYIILVFVAMTIILIFNGLTTQTHSVSISSPNESTFELLQTQYPSTISCPCSQISIEYSTFLSIEPSAYHQICSSGFIESTFILALWGSETLGGYYSNIDAKILSTQFRLLSLLCPLAKDTIDRNNEIFFSQKFITIDTLTRSSFETQMNTTIQSFIDQTPADFRRTHQYIIDMFHANQLHNVFYTNWDLILSNAENNYILSTRPESYNESNEVCSCDTSSTCSKSVLFNYSTATNSSGLVLGCLPAYGLRQSTLECLYDSQCLNGLGDFIDYWDLPEPLNISLPSRFYPVSSVTFGTLIDELFIESWINSSNYSAYFSTCAPLTCGYSYTKRSNFLYMLTTFLGLYGGLTVALKLIVWHVLLIYWKMDQSIIHRHRRINPMN